MIFLDRQESYALFLQCDWWKALSRRKRTIVPRCERCGRAEYLQCHHRTYPDHLFDVTLEHLEVVCLVCHEIHHGFRPKPKIPDPLPGQSPWSATTSDTSADYKPKPLFNAYQEIQSTVPHITSWRQLMELRSHNQISREQFDKLKQQLGPKRKRRTSRRKGKQKWPDSMKIGFGKKGLNFRQIRKWVNRGSSSN